MCPMLTVSRENTFDEFIGYRYQGNTLREGFFYTEKTLAERREYPGYNPIDVDVARVARTRRTHRKGNSKTTFIL